MVIKAFLIQKYIKGIVDLNKRPDSKRKILSKKKKGVGCKKQFARNEINTYAAKSKQTLYRILKSHGVGNFKHKNELKYLTNIRGQLGNRR